MMTSLQIILAAVGVLFIVLIVGYNIWQERRYRKEASRMFSTRREDILLGESAQIVGSQVGDETLRGFEHDLDVTSRPTPSWQEELLAEADERAPEADTEPAAPRGKADRVMDLGRFEPDRTPAPRTEAPAMETLEVPASVAEPATPTASPAKPEAAPAPIPEPPVVLQPVADTPPARFEAESPLDQDIEYVARLRFTKPVFVSYNILLDRLRKVGKAVRGMGRRADGGWDALSGHPANAYELLEFGILLSDRGGALSQEQLEQFCRALYDFAAEEGGAVSCPDKHGALEKARELDMFCVDVDVLIGLNVVARDRRPFNGMDIDRLARQAGLVLGQDGAYTLAGADGQPLFSIANQEDQPFRPGGVGGDTHGLSLIFDLPRVRDGIEAFDRMTALGRQLADNLGGRLVDDNGRLVTQDSLQKDRKRLNDYFARMQARGVPAGGERALRLFA